MSVKRYKGRGMVAHCLDYSGQVPPPVAYVLASDYDALKTERDLYKAATWSVGNSKLFVRNTRRFCLSIS